MKRRRGQIDWPEQEAMTPEELRSTECQPIRRWGRDLFRPTLAELLAWCEDHELDLAHVRLTNSEISWYEVETGEERDKRVRHWTTSDQAREGRRQRQDNAIAMIGSILTAAK